MMTFRLLNFAQHFADEMGRDVLGVDPNVFDEFASKAKENPSQLEALGRQMAEMCPLRVDNDSWGDW